MDRLSAVGGEGTSYQTYPQRNDPTGANDCTDRQQNCLDKMRLKSTAAVPFYPIHGNYNRESDSHGRRMKGATAECIDLKSEYETFGSVWFGEEDAELLERLLLFYPRKPPRRILDATVNGGRFWRKSTRARSVVGLDIDPQHRPKVCGDNTAMPFKSEAFDVVVYDPPHVPNQGQDRSKDFNTRFGLGKRSAKENGYSFAYTYPAFMSEAWRVLKDEGILLAKITDYVHNHRYQWAHVELIYAGQQAGFTACDCIIKVRKGPIIDPKWKKAHHSRRQHCYWIVFRKSDRCE